MCTWGLGFRILDLGILGLRACFGVRLALICRSILDSMGEHSDRIDVKHLNASRCKVPVRL